MNEALHLARSVTKLFNDNKIKDGGADYILMVTDTAGTIASIRFNKETRNWEMEEGFPQPDILMRSYNTNQSTVELTCGVCNQPAKESIITALGTFKK